MWRLTPSANDGMKELPRRKLSDSFSKCVSGPGASHTCASPGPVYGISSTPGDEKCLLKREMAASPVSARGGGGDTDRILLLLLLLLLG